ncbi:MAG TPA: DUF2934 domain-containing protein [Verrucomicrobiae bacterium]|nr:DUF2934 domain-containing protein [Verrucomicrobiae bacterium]
MTVKTGRPTEEQIRARAYQIYLARGGQPGHDTDDWLQAEYELMQLPIRKIAELRPPAPRKRNAARPSLVHLVQTALVLGAETISHLK